MNALYWHVPARGQVGYVNMFTWLYFYLFTFSISLHFYLFTFLSIYLFTLIYREDSLTISDYLWLSLTIPSMDRLAHLVPQCRSHHHVVKRLTDSIRLTQSDRLIHLDRVPNLICGAWPSTNLTYEKSFFCGKKKYQKFETTLLPVPSAPMWFYFQTSPFNKAEHPSMKDCLKLHLHPHPHLLLIGQSSTLQLRR